MWGTLSLSHSHGLLLLTGDGGMHETLAVTGRLAALYEVEARAATSHARVVRD